MPFPKELPCATATPETTGCETCTGGTALYCNPLTPIAKNHVLHCCLGLLLKGTLPSPDITPPPLLIANMPNILMYTTMVVFHMRGGGGVIWGGWKYECREGP